MSNLNPQYPLFCGDFPELQNRFISEVKVLRERDPLAEFIVLVTGQLVRVSLRRELARAGIAHANIRFLTTHDLARRIAAPEMQKRKLHRLPDLAADPLMAAAINDCGSRLHYFETLVSRSGFRNALWKTFADLREAGVSPNSLAALPLPSVVANSRFAAKLSDLATIWKALKEKMNSGSLVDATGVLEIAIETSSEDSTPIILYGLDELTALEKQLLSKCFRSGTIQAYLPYHDSEAYTWTRPLLEWYRQHGFAGPQYLDPVRPDAGGTLAALQRGVFEKAVSRASVTPDQSFRLVSAPGRERECDEIVRDLLHSPLSSLLPTRRVGILLRKSENYANLLRTSLGCASVTGYFHSCHTLRETPAGRACSQLSLLLSNRLRRTEVVAFLLSSPLRMPDDFPTHVSTVPAAEWNQFSLLAGITEGRDAWEGGLARLSRQWEERDAGDDDEDGTRRSSNRIESLTLMRSYLERLFDEVKTLHSADTWASMAGCFVQMFSSRVEADETTSAIIQALDECTLLDDLKLPISVDSFRAVLAVILAAPAEREGRFEYHEPCVATLREAKGVVFDEVFLPGLVEREFPAPSPGDPLLSDDDRAFLNRDLHLPIPIPLISETRDRERYLFRTAVNSTRRRVILSFPRIDPAQNRERLPSTYLLRSLETMIGGPADYRAIDRFMTEDPRGLRVSINRLIPQDLPVGTLEYDLSALGQALSMNTDRQRNGQALHQLAYLLARDTFFARGIAVEQARFHRSEYSNSEGVVADAALAERYANWGAEHLKFIAPTRMEQYAVCPFRYFGLHILELEAAEEPGRELSLSPLERGSLLHDILEKFYRRERDEQHLPVSETSWIRMEQTAKEQFRHWERTRIVGLAMLWDMERRRLLNVLRNHIDFELAREDGFVPAYFEVSYGIPGSDPNLQHPEPIRLKLSDGTTLLLRGRIDRVDVNKMTGQARVVDYKSGRQPKYLKDKSRYGGGRALQLPAYLLAAKVLLSGRGHAVNSASYHFFGGDRIEELPFVPKSADAPDQEFVTITASITDGIRSGRFFPWPEDPGSTCRNCPMIVACGPGRFSQKWRTDLSQTKQFRSMREIP